MKKNFIILFLILHFFAHAQDANALIEKLKIDLKSNPDAKKTASIYSDLTWYYSNISIDSALYYGKKAIAESTKLNDSTLIAQVYSDVGAVYFRKGDYINSKQNYQKAYFIRKLRNDFAGMSKVNANLANIYNKLGDKKLALKSYLETIDYFEKSNNQEVVAITKANVGFLFHEIKNYPKAMKYLNDAISYQEKNKLDNGLCTSYLTLGNVYLKMKDTLKALSSYEKSIVSSKKVGNKISLSSALVNIGSIKSFQKKSAEANNFYNKSKQLRDSINISNEESILSLGIVKEHIMHGRFELAKSLLLKLKKPYETDINDKENLLQTYQFLIQTSAHLNQSDSVILYVEKFSKLENKILGSNIIKQTNELETKYQTEKKEKLLLQKEIEAKQKNTTIIILSIFAFFTALFGFLIYRQQKLKNAQQNQEFELKNAILKIENQNKLQEQRLSISRDLHDNIGAQLTFIISSVDSVKYAFDIQNPKLDNKLTNISSFAKDTIVELRDTIWAMNSNEISYEDLETRINNYIEKAKEAKDKISFSFAIDEGLKTQKLTSVEGMNIYRTIQEAVNNSLKYANANIISINVKKLENHTKITILDNGNGFDQATIESGNGLQNMQKRIEEIGGKFDLTSNNKGTRIEILI
jgi:signal transduction histidine kinase